MKKAFKSIKKKVTKKDGSARPPPSPTPSHASGAGATSEPPKASVGRKGSVASVVSSALQRRRSSAASASASASASAANLDQGRISSYQTVF